MKKRRKGEKMCASYRVSCGRESTRTSLKTGTKRHERRDKTSRQGEPRGNEAIVETGAMPQETD